MAYFHLHRHPHRNALQADLPKNQRDRLAQCGECRGRRPRRICAADSAPCAVTARLVSTVPSDLEILGPGKAPTDPPPFAIALHLRRNNVNKHTAELARHLRDSLSRLQSAA